MGVNFSLEKIEYASVAQSVERVLGKDEVSGSIPDRSSKEKARKSNGLRAFSIPENSAKNTILRF